MVGICKDDAGFADSHRQSREMNEAFMLSSVRNHELNEEADRLKLQMEAEIAERKLVEEQLRDSLQAHRDLQAAIDQHSIVAITDLQGRITYANDKFCTLSQYSRPDLLGKDHRIVNSGFHPKEFIRELWATIGQGKVWKGEIKNRAKDGTFYWLETTIIPSLEPFIHTQASPKEWFAWLRKRFVRQALEGARNRIVHAERNIHRRPSGTLG